MAAIDAERVTTNGRVGADNTDTVPLAIDAPLEDELERSGRVVVVTGASAGLGRAIALEFARRGDTVALLARDMDRLAEVATCVKEVGGAAIEVPVDIASFDEVRRAGSYVAEVAGGIDVWVNNAMTSVFAPFREVEIDEFVRATEVDYLGFVYGTRVALDVMLPRDHGTIVQVSSALGFRSIPLQSAYCGAKHGIIGFTEALRTELLHDRSRVEVTMVHMPALNTPQFDWVRSKLGRRARPVAPVYQPEVAARAVRYAADHPRRRGYYVGASTLATSLANKVVPALLDRYLARRGYDAQQTDETEDPTRPDNLDATVHRGVGAHGRFDEEAKGRSSQFWLSTHRTVAALTVALVAVTATLAPRVARSRRRVTPRGGLRARISSARRRSPAWLHRGPGRRRPR